MTLHFLQGLETQLKKKKDQLEHQYVSDPDAGYVFAALSNIFSNINDMILDSVELLSDVSASKAAGKPFSEQLSKFHANGAKSKEMMSSLVDSIVASLDGADGNDTSSVGQLIKVLYEAKARVLTFFGILNMEDGKEASRLITMLARVFDSNKKK